MSEKDETVTSETPPPPADRQATRRRRLPAMNRPTVTVASARTLLARLVWLVCVIFALVLAIAVLLIAVKANVGNDFVVFDIHFADHVDLSIFDLRDPIKDFDKSNLPPTDVKTALFNYGICALVWLAIGKIADAIIRPRTTRTK